MTTLTVLLAFVCTSAAMDSCTVWEEGRWVGRASPVYCTAERDVATLRTLPGQFIRYECESMDIDDHSELLAGKGGRRD